MGHCFVRGLELLLGMSLLFPKYYLIFYSEFPELLPLRVDHKVLVTLRLTKPKNDKILVKRYMKHVSYMYIIKSLHKKTQKSHDTA